VQIGEKYEDAALTRVEEAVERHQVGYQLWLQDVADARHRLSVWDMDDFWSRVTVMNLRISKPTLLFVDAWVKAVVNGQVSPGMTDRGLRELVARREQSIKRGQSRLMNDKLLRTWSRESGSGRLVYRWPAVRRIPTRQHEPRRTDAGT
jgi:hypothetical protein